MRNHWLKLKRCFLSKGIASIKHKIVARKYIKLSDKKLNFVSHFMRRNFKKDFEFAATDVDRKVDDDGETTLKQSL